MEHIPCTLWDQPPARKSLLFFVYSAICVQTHLNLRTHGPEHSIFVTDTFILIPYALTWDSMMYHHCEKVPAALWVYHGVH